MTNITVNLAIVTLSHKLNTVYFHSQPEIPLSSYFLCQHRPVHMDPAYSLMHCFHELLGLFFVDTPQMDPCRHSLVQHPLITDKLSRQHSQRHPFLLFCIFRKFSRFQVILQVMKPWLFFSLHGHHSDLLVTGASRSCHDEGLNLCSCITFPHGC